MNHSTDRTDGVVGGRIADSNFTSRPWRAHDVLDDGFVLEDVWALPIVGGADDLEALARYAASDENTTLASNPLVRGLFAARWKIGRLLGWDDKGQQVGTRVASLRDDLPDDLRGSRGPDMTLTPFRSVYLTHDEWLSEFSGSMGHIVMHHGWVRRADGTYYSQMSGLVKPHGRFGPLYMLSIRPIRRLVVYPLQFRAIRRVWPNVRRGS